jgi:hypothetical protein
MNWVTGALKLLPLIVSAVSLIERMAGAKSGKEKQDEAIAMVGEFVPLVEGTIGRDVVNESSVQDAIRKVIDAVVALQNVVRDVMAQRAATAGR